MADLKISELTPATTPLTGAEQVPIVQGGQNRRVSASQFAGSNHDHTLSQITDAGTAAAYDVPASPGAQAALDEVVRGDDPRLSASSGGGPAYTNRGEVTGTVTVDMQGGADVVQAMTLVGNATIAVTNPPSTFAQLTLLVMQDATGGRSLALPGNSQHLNGGDGSIDPRASRQTVIVLLTRDGGASWQISTADSRPTRFDPVIINPQTNGSYYFSWDADITLELGSLIQRGSGSVAFARQASGGGSFNSVSGSVNLSVGEVLRVTVTNLSGWYSLVIPRSQ